MGDRGGADSETRADDAFAVLSDETRLDILRTLGELDGPASFSELYARVDYDTTSNFGYHLRQLDGLFLQKTADGYGLREAGRRVVEAVLSGVMTDESVVEPAQIDESCPYCGSTIEVSYHQAHIDIFCPNCPGTYGRVGSEHERDIPAEYGHIGAVHLPPAGLQHRSADGMTRAALTWLNLEIVAISRGVCPRCSAQLDATLAVCENHDAADDICTDCGNRHAVNVEHRCLICKFEESGGFWNALWGETDFLSFLTDHGINPIATSPSSYSTIVASYEEDVLSVDPFEARFTFSIDQDSISLTVDEGLTVVDANRDDVAELKG